MVKNKLLRSIHKNINLAHEFGNLNFLDSYATKKLSGYFSSRDFTFKITEIFSWKLVNQDYSFLNSRMSQELIPFLKCENGDRIAMHFKSGQIFIWELNRDLLSDDQSKKERKIADSWSDFIKQIKSIVTEVPQNEKAQSEIPKSSSFISKIFGQI